MPSWAWWLGGLIAGAALFVLALPTLITPMLRVALRLRYRFLFVGAEHLPLKGPVLVASNHVTWIDGFLLAAVSPRRGMALVNADYISLPFVRWLARRAGMIPVPAQGPRAQRAAIEAVRRAFDRGEMVLIFPEAQLTRTGFLGPFYRGLEVMMKGHEHVPVIPVYLGGLWGSAFSFRGGRFLAHRPTGRHHDVVVALGPPVPTPVTAFATRQAVAEAGVLAAASAPNAFPPLTTIDPALPCLDHPRLGLIAASAPNFDREGIHQSGHKEGTLGQAPPGVALRIVDAADRPLSPGVPGRLQARTPPSQGWSDTGRLASLDREGFVHPADPNRQPPPS